MSTYEEIRKAVGNAAAIFKLVCGVGNNAAWVVMMEGYDHARRCKAFRKSLNSNVFEAMDISPQVRAYMFGHSVKVNLTNYSCKRRENARNAGYKLNAWNEGQKHLSALARSISLER